MIGSGWHTFVQVGLALARVRDGELHKTEDDSFEAYYRVKWQYGRHTVNGLISAAQVFTHLVTIGHQTKPEYESQVRSLVGINITDVAGAIQYVNPAFERITGYTKKEVVGHNPRIFKSGRYDAAFYRQMWGALTRGEVWHGHFINKKKDGTVFEADATISRYSKGQMGQCLLLFTAAIAAGKTAAYWLPTA